MGRGGRLAAGTAAGILLLAGLAWWAWERPRPASAPQAAPGPAQAGHRPGTDPSPPAALKGRLAIVLDDWGYQREPLRRLESLPGPLTLAVLPRLAYSRLAAETGRSLGHEVIVHYPMAAKGGGHPEPGLLKPGLGWTQVRELVEEGFASVPGAVGLNNHEGSLATQDRALMDAVAAVLAARGAYFLDSVTTSRSAIPAAAKAAGVPWAARRVFLDNADEPAAVEAQLEKAVGLALRRGSCIAIGHPRRSTLDVLQARLGGLAGRGVELVPASALLARP